MGKILAVRLAYTLIWESKLKEQLKATIGTQAFKGHLHLRAWYHSNKSKAQMKTNHVTYLALWLSPPDHCISEDGRSTGRSLQISKVLISELQWEGSHSVTLLPQCLNWSPLSIFNRQHFLCIPLRDADGFCSCSTAKTNLWLRLLSPGMQTFVEMNPSSLFFLSLCHTLIILLSQYKGWFMYIPSISFMVPVGGSTLTFLETAAVYWNRTKECFQQDAETCINRGETMNESSRPLPSALDF